MNKPTWVEKAYKGTDVHWGKTQSKIMTMLEEIGINQIRFTALEDRFILEFMTPTEDNNKIPRAIRIVTPLQTRPTDEPRKRNAELNILHRVLFYRLRSKFISVGRGVVEFESEFMAHLVITDKDGNTSTMGEKLLPQYKKNLEGGSEPFLLDSGK